MLIRLTSFALVALAVGCGTAPDVEGGTSSDLSAKSSDQPDATPWCPASPAMTVDDSPSDYLSPIAVTLDSTIDGDTAYFELSSGTVERIRFMHINAEEVRHPEASASQNARATAWGEITKDYVDGLLKGAHTIQISSHRSATNPDAPDTDVFGRWLALIWIDGELLQAKLVSEGYSGYYTKYGCALGKLHDALLWGEAAANQANKGIWDPQYRDEHLPVLESWIGLDDCRPDPLKGDEYCPAP